MTAGKSTSLQARLKKLTTERTAYLRDPKRKTGFRFPHVVGIKTRMRKEIYLWLNENCQDSYCLDTTGKVHLQSGEPCYNLTFVNLGDAIRFKLTHEEACRPY